jgi:putative transposase
MILDNNNHSVFLLYYHLVLVTKYRRKVMENRQENPSACGGDELAK